MRTDPLRRLYLAEKYGIEQPPTDPAENTTVLTTLAAQRLEHRAFARGTEYNQWLFDPSRSPKMHAIATKAHRELREAIARGDIECEDPNDDRVLVHFVGSCRVESCERGLTADRFARRLREHDATQPYCDDYHCNIEISDLCADIGAGTMLMPLLFGGILLVFECCAMCRYIAWEMVSDTHTTNLMEAYEQLPPGSVVLPDHLGQGGFVVPDLPQPATPPRRRSRWARLRAWLRG